MVTDKSSRAIVTTKQPVKWVIISNQLSGNNYDNINLKLDVIGLNLCADKSTIFLFC